MPTRSHADSGQRFSGHSPSGSVPGLLGPLFLAGALLIGVGCGGRTALLGGVANGGAAGGNPWTRDTSTGGSIRPEVGAGGSAGGDRDAGIGGARDAGGGETPKVGPDARRDGAASEVADAGRDSPVDRGLDAAPDGAVEVRSDARSDAGRLDAGADGGGWLKLLAGGLGGLGDVDGVGAAARFYSPNGIASDGAGNFFVVDQWNHTIRKVVIATGKVTTLAGSPRQQGSSDGTGPAARFNFPRGIASDKAGNLFVTDTANQTIRKVVIATGEVTTLAGSPGQTGSNDGTGAATRFSYPYGIASDVAGSLFVADWGNSMIHKLAIATGEVTLLAGSVQPGSSDGIGAAAQFYYPADVASDGAGNLFVADFGNDTIRKVVIATGEVTTLAGSAEQRGSSDGIGAAARFNGPHGIASDRAGNLFVADSDNHTIRRIAIGTRTVTTVVGSPDRVGVALGPLPAGLNTPRGLAVGPAGELYVSDDEEGAILVVQFY
jgi:sugar lactone lactonase YvrE